MVTAMRKSAAGASLIEVLVSLLVLSLGVLAVAALQLIAKRNNMDAGQRTIAAQLAYDIIERMRANSSTEALVVYVANASPYPTAFVGYDKLGEAPSVNCTGPTDLCSAVQLARHDLWEWEESLDGAAETEGASGRVGGLNYPTACIEGPVAGGSGLYTVTIAWRGTIDIPDRNSDSIAANDVGCGIDRQIAGARVYDSGDGDGDQNDLRRIVQISAYITVRAS